MGFSGSCTRKKRVQYKIEVLNEGCLSWACFATKGWVEASRGLRQEDPLASYLFIIIVDGLSRMLVRAEERGLVEGFIVGRVGL